MYKLNCIKWMFVCGLAFRISYVIIGMSYLQYPTSNAEAFRNSVAPPTIRSFSFVINISWTFWWMSTWYIILGCRYANFAIIWGAPEWWRTSELREATAAEAAAASMPCEKVTFLFAFVHWHKSIPNRCKPIVYDSVSHSGWISVRFIDAKCVQWFLPHSIYLSQSDLYILNKFFGSVLFCGKRIKSKSYHSKWIPLKYLVTQMHCEFSRIEILLVELILNTNKKNPTIY